MSEEAEKKEGEGGHEEAAAGGGGGKKKLIIIAVVALLAVGGGAFAFLGGSKPPEGEQAEEIEEKKEYKVAELDTFIVNLSESTSFLKVKMLVEYDPATMAEGEGGAEGGGGHGGGGGGGGGAEKNELPPMLKARYPMIRDAIIRVISGKRATDVLTVTGKETLKQELIEAINEATGLDEPPVVNVYFTEFIIQ
ncbi:MAG: flagellar FliL protein [Pseudomonadota bacterium]|jgi:flagellar FliL protein